MGLSTVGLKRPKAHLYPCNWKRASTHKANWIKSVVAKGEPPLIRVVQSWGKISLSDLADAEVYWIAYFRGNGSGLTNLTDGGEGSTGLIHSNETRAKMSAVKKGRKLSSGHVANISKAQRGRKHSPETKARMSVSHTGAGHSEATRVKLSQINKGKKHSPETKAKISASLRGRKLSPEACANMSAARKGKSIKPWSEERRASGCPWLKGRKHSAATKAKMSVARKKYWGNK